MLRLRLLRVLFLFPGQVTESERVRAGAFVVTPLCKPAAEVNDRWREREPESDFFVDGPGEGGSSEKGEFEKSLERRRARCSGSFELNLQ